MAEASGGEGGYVFRDRDPPPSYAGENPQSTFRPFLPDLELWQASTDIPVEKQGVKLVQGLKGPAKAAVDALPVSSIKGPDGYKEVLKALKDAFQPYVETALPRAMEQVFFGAPRHHKESLADYLVRASNAQALLKDEGVDLPSKAAGYLLFRQANLDSELEARLTTWLAGDFSRDNVVANLRRLERVHQEGSKTVLLADFGDADGEEAGHLGEQEAFLYDGPEDDSGEDFVYLNDGDLAEVMDEDEVMEALATYQQVRQHLKDTRLGRKFRRPPPLEGKGAHKFGKQSGGKFSGNPAGKGKGKGQFSPEARRVHIEQLKLRTRCRSCGQVGHWSKECRNAPHSASSQTGASSTSRSSTSFYWSADSPTRAGTATFFTFGEAREMRENECSQALLQDSGFVGVTTADHQALVDTCAQEGLIGKPALLRLCDALRAQGLRCLWLDKVAAARGIGGSAKTVGVVELPLGLAGVSGVLEATVVAEDVPLLLPVSLLRSLGAVLDFPGEKLTLTAVPVDMAMQALPSGHPAETTPPRPAAERRVVNRGRLALRNWRVVFDKLYSLLRWGHYHTLASQFMSGAPLPSAPSSSGTEVAAALAPTEKARFYKGYLQDRNPEKMAPIKGLPPQSPETCAHEARFLKGGGNGHANWIHCAQCHSRWKVSPRSAAKVTGRELETTTTPAVTTSKAKAKPGTKRQAKTEGTMEPSTDEFLKVIADQQEKLELAESQVALLTGNTIDLTLAEEAAAAPGVDDDRSGVQRETRFKSNHFPTSDTRAEWAAAAENYRVAANQIVTYYQGLMAQRSQSGTQVLVKASQAMVKRWARVPTPGVEDFVVIRARAGMERHDRAEHSTLDCDKHEIFLVLDEPEIAYLDVAEEVGEIYHDLFAEQGKLVGASWADAPAELGTEASPLGRAKDWCAWTRAGAEAILELPTTSSREQVDHVASVVEALRASTLRSSAAYLLYRKQGLVTNVTDTERYWMAKGLRGPAQCSLEVEGFPIDPDAGAEEAEPADPEPEVKQPTEREKEGIMKLHRNLGPDKATLARVLRVGGAPEYAWKWVKQEFRCPTCESGVLPKAHRPATVPRNFSPNTAMAIDLIDLPSWNGAMIIVDQGTEYLSDFRDRCSQMGVVLHVIGARAPQQNSRAERHGGLYKAMLQRAKWMNPPASADEYKVLLREVESAKNRLSDRSEYSPAQRVIGENPKTTGELLSDELVEAALLGDGPEIQKKVAARTAAQKAFAEVNNSQAIRRALRARPRTTKVFRPGDIVFVWRTWRSQGVRRACWTGPGVVVLPEGANAYVNMKGRLWKCANEHLRDGTSEEIRGVEAVNDIFQDMAQRFKATGREHRVVTDLTGDPLLPGSERESQDTVEAEGEARGLPRVRIEEPETPVPALLLEPPTAQEVQPELPEPPVPQVPLPTSPLQPAAPPSRATTEEPDVEAPAREHRVSEAVEAARRAARLDGHVNPPGPEPGYGAARQPPPAARLQAATPYHREALEDDFFEQSGQRQQPPHRDHWEFFSGEGRLRRHHVKWRSSQFSPWEASQLPVALHLLSSERTTCRKFKKGDVDEISDHWRELKPSKRAPAKWRGYTDFFLTKKGLKEAKVLIEQGALQDDATELYFHEGGFEVFAAKKTASDEVKEKDISQEEWPSWIRGAVVLRTLEESRVIWDQLAREVIDSRIVRRRKPGEQLGEEASLKSRWVVRGDQDPDSADIEVYAPTVCTQNLQVLLQTVTSLGMAGSCGDLKAAFTQSAPLVRAGGRLFVRIPRNGGPPGAHEEQLLEIVKGIYGLVDGPRHWRATLKDFVVKDLEYQQSRLDPTIFLLFSEHALEGVLVIEVDDILSFGHKTHDAKMQQLRSRFKFNGRRVQQGHDYVLKVDMAKFVEERLAPLTLERGRKSKPDEPVTEDERQRARGLLGSLAWLAKEGRPDVAGATSMLASRIGSLKVRDLIELNRAVEEAKKLRDLTLCFYPIKPQDLGWGAITDASWANHSDGSSQGALAIIAFDRAILDGRRAPCSLIWWKSAKLKRKVGSTLAAETQSLLKGLGELMWAKAIHGELMDPGFSLEKFRASVQAQADIVLQKTDADPKLKDSLAVVDAKSLYDNLMKEGAQAQDKFTALDIDGLGVQVCWVEHQSMPVDSLTKIGAGKDCLLDLIQTGTFKLEA
ncbi:GIP, partial [Symbiodinium necroappetens]